MELLQLVLVAGFCLVAGIFVGRWLLRRTAGLADAQKQERLLQLDHLEAKLRVVGDRMGTLEGFLRNATSEVNIMRDTLARLGINGDLVLAMSKLDSFGLESALPLLQCSLDESKLKGKPIDDWENAAVLATARALMLSDVTAIRH